MRCEKLSRECPMLEESRASWLAYLNVREETNMTPTEKAKWFLDGSVANFRNAKLNNSLY